MLTGPECQARWKSIRDHYKRQKKEDKGRTGSAAKKKRASYWDRLSFLDTVEDERNTISNIPSECTENDSRETHQSHATSMEDISLSRIQEPVSNESGKTVQTAVVPVPVPRKRRDNSIIEKYLKEKKTQTTQLTDCIKQLTQPGEEDDVDFFFKSIALSVKKLPPELITQTKVKVLDTVTKMELLHQRGARNHPLYVACPENYLTSSQPSPFTAHSDNSFSSVYNSEVCPSSYNSSEPSPVPMTNFQKLSSNDLDVHASSQTGSIINDAFEYALKD